MGAPVVTTISGQGIMPDQHALALGVIGDNGFHPHAIRAVEEADALLYVGCKMGSVSTVQLDPAEPRAGAHAAPGRHRPAHHAATTAR